MGIVVRNDLHSGMTLAQDVRDHHGRLLLGMGAVLEDKHIRMFKLLGIASVKVQEQETDPEKEAFSAPEMPNPVSADALARARALALNMFHHNLFLRTHPLFPVLLSYCIHEATDHAKHGSAAEEPVLLRDSDAARRYRRAWADARVARQGRDARAEIPRRRKRFRLRTCLRVYLSLFGRLHELGAAAQVWEKEEAPAA